MTNAESVKRYQGKRDAIMLRPDKETGATIRAAAAAASMSVQGYVLEAVREKMERERAGAVSPAVEDVPGMVMVNRTPAQNDTSSSQSPPLTPPDSSTGQSDNEPEFIKVVKRLSAMSADERDKAMGCDEESKERYREREEYRRQRLAELNAKPGGLSRSEEMERRRLMMMEHQDHLPPDSSTQE